MDVSKKGKLIFTEIALSRKCVTSCEQSMRNLMKEKQSFHKNTSGSQELRRLRCNVKYQETVAKKNGWSQRSSPGRSYS